MTVYFGAESAALGGFDFFFFAPLYFVSIRFALFYFDISKLPRFTLVFDDLPSDTSCPHPMTKISIRTCLTWMDRGIESSPSSLSLVCSFCHC